MTTFVAPRTAVTTRTQQAQRWTTAPRAILAGAVDGIRMARRQFAATPESSAWVA